MATKKFLIEVEEGRTKCDNSCLLKRYNGDCADVYEYVGQVIPFLRCGKYNLATIKITEIEEEKEMNGFTLTLLSFGGAIDALKAGKKVTRMGWNGKGMYLWLKPATTIKAEWCKDPMLKEIVDGNGGEAEALGTICMKTADNKILTGWLASQTDMLSEDWMIIE